MCVRQARKCPNNCFKRSCWIVPYLTSIILCQIFLHTRDSSGLQYQCKNAKMKIFWINSINPTAMNFKVLCRFLICYIMFSSYAMTSDSNHVFSNVRHCFAFFALINKKIIINRVMTKNGLVRTLESVQTCSYHSR